MDAIKNMAGEAKKMTGGNANQAQAGGKQGGEDYADKGLDAIEKKAGMSQNRQMNEKVTDGARSEIEKVSGKDIPDKFSN